MNSLTDSVENAPVRGGIIANLVKRKLFERLSSLPRGSLVIQENDQVYNFGKADDGSGPRAKIVIEDPGAYRDIATGGSMGGAEAYMDGKWTTPNLLELVRLMCVNIDFLNSIDGSTPWMQRLGDRLFHLLNRNTRDGSRQNISRHYDLSNEFFALFLDPEMMYSSAIFPTCESDLDEAAVYKLDQICLKLELKESDHLLEIGSGWGGMAIHAARNYGCRVTTTTISREQYEEACQRVSEAGLENQVTVLLEDYRNLQGQFDKLVSVEMIEAVGHQFYSQYFHGCASLLKDDGLMLLQAITMPEQRYQQALKSVDFIQRYIFPGGSLPSHEAIISSLRTSTDMLLVNMQEIGEDYARTLQCWRERFLERLDEVRALGFDERFIRMWHYYLCYCQGGFEERVIGTSQMLLAKPGWRKSAQV